MKICKHCGKELIKKPAQKRLNPKRIFCNDTCRTRFNSYTRFISLRNDDDYRNRKSVNFKKWYKTNKQSQKERVLKNAKEHRKEWTERSWVGLHRKLFLLALPTKCYRCRKDGVKIIHHEHYDFPKRQTGRKFDEDYFNEYVKHLRVFCSKKCHMAYHRESRNL